jgi:magnesium chelatase family protein
MGSKSKRLFVHGMTIVGLPDAAIQESRERVQAAVCNAGVPYPRKRLVVNLAPASVRKEGPTYDLPIALGVLIYTGMLPASVAEGTMVVGELSLDGAVRHARGVLPMAATARQAGFKRIVVPEVDAPEAALIPDLEIIPVGSLAALYNHLAGRTPIPAYNHAPEEAKPLFPPNRFRRGQGP